MYNGLEYKYLDEIKKLQERATKLLLHLDKLKSECISLILELEVKRNEVEEYIRERGE